MPIYTFPFPTNVTLVLKGSVDPSGVCMIWDHEWLERPGASGAVSVPLCRQNSLYMYSTAVPFPFNTISLLINLQQCHWSDACRCRPVAPHPWSRWITSPQWPQSLVAQSVVVFSSLNGYPGSYFITTNNCLFVCKLSTMTHELFNNFNRCRKPLLVLFCINDGCFFLLRQPNWNYFVILLTWHTRRNAA